MKKIIKITSSALSDEIKIGEKGESLSYIGLSGYKQKFIYSLHSMGIELFIITLFTIYFYE
jgi:hypothetical protein